MLKDKPIDISQTNMALFGTPLEKEIKKAAANGEPAWKVAGKAVGLQVWRIEKFLVKEWDAESLGSFYNGDSYIVLKTSKSGDDFKWDVHFWLGEFTTADEAGTAAYKTVELDDFLGGYPIEYREVQGHESKLFLSYFPSGLKILNGGIDSGFKSVKKGSYSVRLLHIKGKGKKVVAVEVPLNSSSLNSGDAFLLDAGETVYLFIGSKAGIAEKTKGTQLARGLDDERGSKVTVHVISEFEMHKEDEATNEFWTLLGGKVASIKSAAEGGDDDKPIAVKKMFRLSDSSGELQMTEVDFAHKSLHSSDAFIIDTGAEVYVWVGKGTSDNEKKCAMSFGQNYLNQYGRPAWTPLVRVMEGAENEALLSHF